jgi:L-aspartate oxidase
MTTRVPAHRAKTPQWQADAELVVVGSGVAGLTAAVRATELGLRTVLLTKAAVTDSNTRWAQGGVAVVRPEERDPGDTIERHVADTLTAGVGLCDPAAVRSIIADGPAAVRRLRARGAQFDLAANGALARTREGGHSAFRVIHAGGDATGAEVERALAADAREHGVPLLERHIAVDLLRTADGAVGGLLVLDDEGRPGVLRTPAVLLATGGVGQLYQATSNPEIATGDGLALALRAGAAAADLEFVQFHPTVLYTPGARGRCPLVTEAVRGEGAVLVDSTGARVMDGVHPLGDLAPRDVVSAAITRRMAEAPGGVDDHVFLDATGLANFAARFPTVHAACLTAGVDPAREPIPVAPAAHFACGGVLTSTDGRSTVAGLYAAGEVARTGLHGANRLASNSLLEGLVVGARAAEAVARDLAAGELARGVLAHDQGEMWDVGRPEGHIGDIVPRDVLQPAMSRHAAIGRDAAGLAAVASTLDDAAVESSLDTVRAVEDAALTLVARALLVAAAARRESRGAHVRTDHLGRDDAGWRFSQLVGLKPTGEPVLLEPVLATGAA